MATYATLTFDEYPGEEFRVRLSPVSMRGYLDFVEVWGEGRPVAQYREDLATFVRLAEPSWTIAGIEDFMDLDLDLIHGIVAGWLSGIREVPSPLPAASSVSTRSTEDAIPVPANGSAPRRSSSGRTRSTRS